jgi:hypothetical protein
MDPIRILGKYKNELLTQLLASDIKFYLPQTVPMNEVHKIKIDNEDMFVRLYKEN